MTVSFMGYSERGIVIALCDDIVHSKQRIARLGDLLTAIKPGNRLSELIIDEATILVEQGFSDFGDADLVFLIDHTVNGEKKKLAIFVEAKVHTDTSHPKTLDTSRALARVYRTSGRRYECQIKPVCAALSKNATD